MTKPGTAPVRSLSDFEKAVNGLKAGSYTLNMSKKGFKLHYGKPFTLSRNESVEIVLMPEGAGR